MLFNPFHDDGHELNLHGLTITNSADSVSVTGDLNITRDKLGLAQLVDIKKIIDTMYVALSSSPLPDRITLAPIEYAPNPFGVNITME